MTRGFWSYQTGVYSVDSRHIRVFGSLTQSMRTDVGCLVFCSRSTQIFIKIDWAYPILSIFLLLRCPWSMGKTYFKSSQNWVHPVDFAINLPIPGASQISEGCAINSRTTQLRLKIREGLPNVVLSKFLSLCWRKLYFLCELVLCMVYKDWYRTDLTQCIEGSLTPRVHFRSCPFVHQKLYLL